MSISLNFSGNHSNCWEYSRGALYKWHLEFMVWSALGLKKYNFNGFYIFLKKFSTCTTALLYLQLVLSFLKL